MIFSECVHACVCMCLFVNVYNSTHAAVKAQWGYLFSFDTEECLFFFFSFCKRLLSLVHSIAVLAARQMGTQPRLSSNLNLLSFDRVSLCSSGGLEITMWTILQQNSERFCHAPIVGIEVCVTSLLYL